MTPSRLDDLKALSPHDLTILCDSMLDEWIGSMAEGVATEIVEHARALSDEEWLALLRLSRGPWPQGSPTTELEREVLLEAWDGTWPCALALARRFGAGPVARMTGGTKSVLIDGMAAS